MANPPPPPGAYPPPPSYNASQQQQQTIIIQQQQQQQSPAVRSIFFGEVPVGMQCPFCGSQIVTSTESSVSCYTWGICSLIILVGCFVGLPLFLGCCLIPCCLKSCKDIEHKCPSCNHTVGSYSRSC